MVADGKRILIGRATRRRLRQQHGGRRDRSERKTFTLWIPENSSPLATSHGSRTAPGSCVRGVRRRPGRFKCGGALTEHRLSPGNERLQRLGEVGLSADGKTIVTIKGETNSSLWRYSPASNKASQITNDGRTVYGLAGLTQASDGTVFFTSKEGKEYRLWKTDRDGKATGELLKEPGPRSCRRSAPTADMCVFVRQREKTSRIWRMNADGTGPVQMTEENSAYSISTRSYAGRETRRLSGQVPARTARS